MARKVTIICDQCGQSGDAIAPLEPFVLFWKRSAIERLTLRVFPFEVSERMEDGEDGQADLCSRKCLTEFAGGLALGLLAKARGEQPKWECLSVQRGLNCILPMGHPGQHQSAQQSDSKTYFWETSQADGA